MSLADLITHSIAGKAHAEIRHAARLSDEQLAEHLPPDIKQRVRGKCFQDQFAIVQSAATSCVYAAEIPFAVVRTEMRYRIEEYTAKHAFTVPL